MAIASLICGIFFFFFIPAILAIVFGHLALGQIKRSAGYLKGKGMAITGLVLGYGSIAFTPIILIIAAIAIPNLLRARIAANESSAVATLRSIRSAQTMYATAQENRGFACSPSDLQQAGLLSGFSADSKHGYVFEIAACTSELPGGPATGFKAVA